MMAGLLGFSRHAMAGMARVPARHHELLIEKLDDVAEGRCDRLMVQMPPGSAKSTYGSILFPAYFLSRHKTAQIIATAHTASLADYFGRHVRKAIAEHGEWLGVTLAKESRASAKFRLEEGGEYFSAGVRGPITGRRADLIIIDDPVKSWAEAESRASREALYDWYRAELSARLKPGGRLVLIMTRWHEDDLAGRLMAGEPAWENLRLPAIAESGDAMGRAVGQVLWPEWQDEAAVLRRRHEVGERAFSAMYQQRPRPPDAALFKVDAIRILAQAPEVSRTVRAWDLAATLPSVGRNPDYTVGLKLGLAAGGDLVVLDVIRFQGSPAQVEARIHATAKTDGVGTILALPQDPGQAGAAQVAMLKRSLSGFQVVSSPETGAKVMRAMPAATQVDGGKVALLAAPWNENFMSEIRAFPDSAKDDQVDAFSRAVNTLATTNSQVARRVNVALLGR
ncbi:phage terminase large subunit [Acidocella sp.]|uniref:phage terminase large subunit n=1 Tax=Acidocella sp. TaxID=50710 RepID=UPI001801800D|nr:phage terminase large subunit [Acidocella sp.]NNM57718.1 phage terminase large subunit [Acidocella sp.]